MKFYSIFLKERNGVAEDLILLKDGFNPYVIIFNVFWFLYKKCYIITLLLFFLIYISFIFSNLKFSFFIFFSVLTILSFESDRILTKKYVKENYKYLGYTSGNNEIEAKRRFLDSINNEGIENKKDNIIDEKE